MVADASVSDAGAADSGAPDAGRTEVWLPPTGDGTGCSNFLLDAGATALFANDAGFEVLSNITYAVRGGLALQGDLYLPPDPDGGRAPGVLVVIHGGGWQDCNRRRQAVALDALVWAALLDVPSFNVEYRLDEEGGGYPANLVDLKCAVQRAASLVSSAGRRVDPSRVAVIGESAGAHLALMLSLTQGRADLLDPACGAAPAAVTAAVAFSPPTDLPALADAGIASSPAAPAYAGPCATAVNVCGSERACDRCVDASPLAHACGAQGTYLLVHAPEPWDSLVPTTQSKGLAAALRDAGVGVTLFEPSPAALADAGCIQGFAHGFLPCMTQVSGGVVLPFLNGAIGR